MNENLSLLEIEKVNLDPLQNGMQYFCMCEMHIRTTPNQDNSRYWSWWVDSLVGCGPGGELS